LFCFRIHLERSKDIFNWLSKKIEKYGVEVKLTHFNENQNEIFYGYNYRPANYSSINGSICSNNQSYNGVIFGKFKCPIEGFDLDETECCDANDKQFCCKPITSFFNLTLFIMLLALLFAFFIALVIIIICIFRKPQHQLVPYFD
jgi:hypothetical protein